MKLENIKDLWEPGYEARIETQERGTRLPLYIKPFKQDYLEPGDYTCPVCCNAVRFLVGHHDHFSDVCRKILGKEKLDYPTASERTWAQWNCTLTDVFSTFEETYICSSCNSICADIKHKHPNVFPKFTSFSPSEMSDYLKGLAPLTIWETKKLSYKPIVDWFVSKNPVHRKFFISEWNDKSRITSIPKENKPWKIPVDKARNENQRFIRALKECDLGEMVRVAIEQKWSVESQNYFAHGQWIIHMGAPRFHGSFGGDFMAAVKNNAPEYFSELWEECYTSRDFNLVPDYYTRLGVKKHYGM